MKLLGWVMRRDFTAWPIRLVDFTLGAVCLAWGLAIGDGTIITLGIAALALFAINPMARLQRALFGAIRKT
jgi:hypothetical protein